MQQEPQKDGVEKLIIGAKPRKINRFNVDKVLSRHSPTVRTRGLPVHRWRVRALEKPVGQGKIDYFQSVQFWRGTGSRQGVYPDG